MAVQQDGYTLIVTRMVTQQRLGVQYARTVGNYETYFNGQLTGLSGAIVERQGPGDNTAAGVKSHSRIAAGKYPLFTHASPVKNGIIKYKTIGYQTDRPPNATPRPCIGVEATGARAGILIHPASGFVMSTGCFNPSGPLSTGDSNVTWADSKARVIALIEDIKRCLGRAAPTSNGVRLPNAWLIVDGEP